MRHTEKMRFASLAIGCLWACQAPSAASTLQTLSDFDLPSFGQTNTAGSGYPAALALWDPGFGVSGSVQVPFEAAPPSALLIDARERIVVASGERIVRLSPRGQLDTSFGTGGVVAVEGPGGFHIALTFGGDGESLYYSASGPLVRIDGNGIRDTSFSIPTLALGFHPHALHTLPDGSLLAVGADQLEVRAAKVSAAGIIDEAFASAARHALPGPVQLTSMAVHDSAVFLGGTYWAGAPTASYPDGYFPLGYFLAKLGFDGAWVSGFGDGGLVQLPPASGVSVGNMRAKVFPTDAIVLTADKPWKFRTDDGTIAENYGGALSSDLTGEVFDSTSACAVDEHGRVIVVGRNGIDLSDRQGASDRHLRLVGAPAEVLGCALQPDGALVVAVDRAGDGREVHRYLLPLD